MGRSPFNLLSEQANQGDVDLPWPSNLLLTLVEEINKFLCPSSGKDLMNLGAKTARSWANPDLNLRVS